MATDTWEDGYAGSTNASLIDDKARLELKATRERLMQGGHKMTGAAPAAATQNNDGKHVVGVEEGSPAGDTGYFSIYDTAGTDPLVRVHGTAHSTQANKIGLKNGYALKSLGATPLVLEGIAHSAFTMIAFDDPIAVIGYLKRIIWKVPDTSGYPRRTIKAFRLTVGTRPSGSDLVVELRFRDASAGQADTNDDPFIDANTTLITTVTLTAGGNYAVESGVLSQALDPDDELIIKYTGVGVTTPASDVTGLIQLE